MDKERLEAMSKLGIAASKAGEALRNTILAIKKLQATVIAFIINHLIKKILCKINLEFGIQN